MLNFYKKSFGAKMKIATDGQSSGPYNQDLMEISVGSFNNKDLRTIQEVLTKRLNNRDSRSYSILKSLTIIFYLLQNGSEDMSNWVIQSKQLIKSLQYRQFDLKYKDQIKERVASVLSYIEDPHHLDQLRSDIYKLRNEMSTPGLKRSTSTATPRSLQERDISRQAKSFDLPRIVDHSSLVGILDDTPSTNPFTINPFLRS